MANVVRARTASSFRPGLSRNRLTAFQTGLCWTPTGDVGRYEDDDLQSTHPIWLFSRTLQTDYVIHEL
jgi:hypothetical protein